MRRFLCVIRLKGKLQSPLGQAGTESCFWVDLSLAEVQFQCFKVERKNSFPYVSVFCKAKPTVGMHSSE